MRILITLSFIMYIQSITTQLLVLILWLVMTIVVIIILLLLLLVLSLQLNVISITIMNNLLCSWPEWAFHMWREFNIWRLLIKCCYLEFFVGRSGVTIREERHQSLPSHLHAKKKLTKKDKKRERFSFFHWRPKAIFHCDPGHGGLSVTIETATGLRRAHDWPSPWLRADRAAEIVLALWDGVTSWDETCLLYGHCLEVLPEMCIVAKTLPTILFICLFVCLFTLFSFSCFLGLHHISRDYTAELQKHHTFLTLCSYLLLCIVVIFVRSYFFCYLTTVPRWREGRSIFFFCSRPDSVLCSSPRIHSNRVTAMM